MSLAGSYKSALEIHRQNTAETLNINSILKIFFAVTLWRNSKFPWPAEQPDSDYG
jgi:hypothetical protein